MLKLNRKRNWKERIPTITLDQRGTTGGNIKKFKLIFCNSPHYYHIFTTLWFYTNKILHLLQLLSNSNFSEITVYFESVTHKMKILSNLILNVITNKRTILQLSRYEIRNWNLQK